MIRKFTKIASLTFLALIIVSSAYAKGDKGDKNRFVDSDEYKKGEYDKGIIKDYSDMIEGDGVEWAWVAKGVHLGDYKVKVGSFKNMSDVSSHRIADTLEESLERSFDHNKGTRGTLTTENAIYWAEKESEGKRWIPYAGGHLAQAGVGVEMIFRDSSGKTVAKIRHSAREGSDVSSAAEEVADDLSKFVSDN
jgi:hypothetical protein